MDHLDELLAAGAWEAAAAHIETLDPAASRVALSFKASSTAGRILGNVWDVLTFWPLRYHPFAVPPYAERAVPELRHRLRRLCGSNP